MPQDVDPEAKKTALEAISKVHAKGITQDALTEIYDEWAEKYDEDINSELYKGPKYVAEALAEQYTVSDKKDAKILDVAAGTGRIGTILHKLGFQHIDALDPSEKMLEILRKHGIYGKIWKDTIGLHKTEIEDDAYDAVVSSGALGEGHIPVNAINEMVRIVRPGGFIIIVIREEYLTITEEYSKLEPLFDKLEGKKIIKKINRKIVPKYSLDNNGVVFVHQVV